MTDESGKLQQKLMVASDALPLDPNNLKLVSHLTSAGLFVLT